MKDNEKNIYLSVLLIFLSMIVKPHRYVLHVIKIFYRSLAFCILGFMSYKVLPLVSGAFSEVLQGRVSWPIFVITLSYLLLMYAFSLMFLQVADKCTLQLKSRFNIEP